MFWVHLSCEKTKNCLKLDAEGVGWKLANVDYFIHFSGLEEGHKRQKSELKNKTFFLFPLSSDNTAIYYITRLFFLNYRTIDIEIDIFYPNPRIINPIVKFPLSHRLTVPPKAKLKWGVRLLVSVADWKNWPQNTSSCPVAHNGCL
jgi:hypothetical protein